METVGSSANLEALKPKQRTPVMTLVQEAGVDISDWARSTTGNPASNPKYCYEWAFVEKDKVVVLNIWHAHLAKDDGVIYAELNLLKAAEKFAGVRKRRAYSMDSAIQEAKNKQLPVRVVVLEGTMRDIEDEEPDASKVSKRLLDPVPWAVTKYETGGDCRIERGAKPPAYVDQFSLPADGAMPGRKAVAGEVFQRDPAVRVAVLKRARGRCELCGRSGFLTVGGDVYLETHHVVPLAEGGPDTEHNVVALCPEDHRRAHYASDRHQIRTRLLQMIEEW